MTALHMLRCDACDATTPAFADAELVEDEPEPELRTEAQSRKIFALLKDLNVATRELGLALIGDILGEPVESTKALTREQASVVIDALQQEVDAAGQEDGE